MTHTNCAKNYCNRTLIVKVIVENVVTCFLGHSVVHRTREGNIFLRTCCKCVEFTSNWC